MAKRFLFGVGWQIITALIAAVAGAAVSMGISLVQYEPRLDNLEADSLRNDTAVIAIVGRLAAIEVKSAQDIGEIKADLAYISGRIDEALADRRTSLGEVE